MGMVLSFTRVTSEELDRAFEDPEWAEKYLDDEDLLYGDVGKAWAGIQFLLAAADVPLDLYEDGDPIDEDSTLFGWHVDMVTDAAKALSAVPFEALAAHYDSRR